MSPEEVVTIGQKVVEVTGLLAAPLLLSALVVGVLIGVLQAATQINEMTLSFVPKLAALGIVLVVFGPWLLQVLMDFTISLYGNLDQWVK